MEERRPASAGACECASGLLGQQEGASDGSGYGECVCPGACGDGTECAHADWSAGSQIPGPGRAVARNPDDTLILAYTDLNEYYGGIAKLTAEGAGIWWREENVAVYDVIVGSDGYIYATGSTPPNTSSGIKKDFWVAKIAP